MRMFGFGRKKATPVVPVRECRNPDHPAAVHWHYGYGQRHWSYDGPVVDDFSTGDSQWAKGADL